MANDVGACHISISCASYSPPDPTPVLHGALFSIPIDRYTLLIPSLGIIIVYHHRAYYFKDLHYSTAFAKITSRIGRNGKYPQAVAAGGAEWDLVIQQVSVWFQNMVKLSVNMVRGPQKQSKSPCWPINTTQP